MLKASYSTTYIGFAFRTSALRSAGILIFRNDASNLVTLSLTSVGRLAVVRGDYNSGALLGTSIDNLLINVYYYIEVKIVSHSTAGSVVVRVNGVEWLNLTDQNTTSTSVNSIGWFYNPSGFQAFTVDIDDIYVLDTSGTNNNFLGDTRVQYLAPSGAGIRTNFTPLSSTNWSNVDDATPNDNDYNSSSVVGATDLFAMPDIGNGLVHGVQTVLRYKKDDAGFRTVQPVLYRADVDDGGLPPPSTTPRWYRGTKVPVYDTFAGSTQVLDTSPLSGLSWTKDEINALQFGYAVGDAAMFTIDAKLV